MIINFAEGEFNIFYDGTSNVVLPTPEKEDAYFNGAVILAYDYTGKKLYVYDYATKEYIEQ